MYTCFELGCARRPYVCARILVPKSRPNLSLVASVSLFYLCNMFLCWVGIHAYKSLLPCFALLCFVCFVDVSRVLIWLFTINMQWCIGVVMQWDKQGKSCILVNMYWLEYGLVSFDEHEHVLLNAYWMPCLWCLNAVICLYDSTLLCFCPWICLFNAMIDE